VKVDAKTLTAAYPTAATALSRPDTAARQAAGDGNVQQQSIIFE